MKKNNIKSPFVLRISLNFGALLIYNVKWQFHLRKPVTCDIILFHSNSEFLLND